MTEEYWLELAAEALTNTALTTRFSNGHSACAALPDIHHTIEDTETKREEIESHFGLRICSIVVEVTDDKSLQKQERKAAQIAHAPHLSREAQSLKLADKISNVFDVAFSTPVDWPAERQLAYFDWASQVVAGLRGCNAALEALFDEQVARSREFVKDA